MKVHEIMTAHARCAAPDNSVVEAAGLMRELDVGVLPVCENDRLAGMVTDRDIVLRAVADGRDAYETTVREVMSPGVLWVFADQDVEEAARIMEEKQVRRLPVLNREKRLVGIVSLGDVAVTSNPAFSGQALREVSESPEEHMRGGRTPSAVRTERMASARVRGPEGTGRVPAGARQSRRRGRKSDTSAGRDGGGSARRREPARSTGRGRRRNGGGTTGGAAGRSAGARRQPKSRKKKATTIGSARRRGTTARAAR